MSDKILLRRGNKADLPVLNVGEPGFATDTGEFFMGRATGNEQIYAPYDKRSAFRANSTAVQPIPAATNTKVLFPTESFDNQNEYNASTSQFTAKAAGIYNVTAAVDINSNLAGNRLIMSVYVNGSKHTVICNRQTGGTADEAATGCAPVKLNVNDIVEIYLFSTGAFNTGFGSADCYFAVTRIA